MQLCAHVARQSFCQIVFLWMPATREADRTYAGYGNNFKGMAAVLEAALHEDRSEVILEPLHQDRRS